MIAPHVYFEEQLAIAWAFVSGDDLAPAANALREHREQHPIICSNWVLVLEPNRHPDEYAHQLPQIADLDLAWDEDWLMNIRKAAEAGDAWADETL